MASTSEHSDQQIGLPKMLGGKPYDTIRRSMTGQHVRMVFDVGANVGQSAREYLVEFPEAKIISFEPVQSTYSKLLSGVNSSSRVCCMNLALGPGQGELTIYHQHDSQLNSLHPPRNEFSEHQGTQESVQVTTIDKIVEDNEIPHIDFLKIDTEHYEIPVLEGAVTTLSHDRVSFIYAEVTFDLENELHTNYFELAQFLAQYDFFCVGAFESVHWPNGNSIDYCNVLFNHRNKLGNGSCYRST
jgi:FkbM family methyltransferase